MLYQADLAARRGVLFVLAHGAGAGQSSPWMVRYARKLSERGLDVVTFNFPYMEAGRRAPDRAPVLEATFRQVVASAVAHRHVQATRLFIGGKSMGGRMATHLAAADDWPAEAPQLNGVVAFGYPLKPPGGSRVSPDRVTHLLQVKVPVLIVQGTKDSFGGPEDIRLALESGGGTPPITIHAIDGGDHSLTLRAGKRSDRTQETVDQEVLDRVTAWIDEQSEART